MRRILLPILSLVLLSIATAGALSSCTQETKHRDSLDTTVIKPEYTDSIDIVSVTGKVVDGAMNSVFLEVAPDSAIEFTYSNLDRNNDKVFYNWSIDDNVTIKYVKTERNGEPIDSVISIQKAE